MNIKKNDKIILIVGVVILALAAVGVALYTSPDEGDAGNTEPIIINYDYEWIKKTGEYTFSDDFYAGRNEPYSDMKDVASPEGSVLTNVEIILSWEDDNTYGLIIRRGHDTLTASLGIVGSDQEEQTSIGSGNLSFLFTMNEKPMNDYEPAESSEKALEIIKNKNYMKNKATFNIDVSVSTGERIWRLLNNLRDKGNDFDLMAKYTYYEVNLLEPEIEEDEDKPTGDDGGYNTAIGEFYKNLCYGRGMI
jgi:hypothetical protein